AERVLSNYAGCIQSSETEARLKTAHGLTQMAAMLGGFPQVLQQSMALAGEQLVHEPEPEMQRSVSSCFVRLSQEAVGRRKYVAVQQALAAVDCIEQKLTELGAHLRSRLVLHDRLPEFISEALRTAQPPADLLEMLHYADTMLLPQIIDEIGLSGDRDASARMMTLAFDQAGSDNRTYLQLKAVEALGRLRELKAESHLRLIVEGRYLWTWKHPRE